jgi:hypothetical protein
MKVIWWWSVMRKQDGFVVLGMVERGSGVRLAIENWQRDDHGLFDKWWIAGMELMV